MYKKVFLYFVCNVLLITIPLFAAPLVINGLSDKVYDGGTYDYLQITNSSNIIVRNALFTTPSSVRNSNTIIVERCEFNGLRNINSCNAITVRDCDNVILQYNKVHDWPDDAFVLYSVKDVKCLNNEIYNLMACGTDSQYRCNGPCFNGHSDAFEPRDFQNLEISGNLVHEMKGTSGMFMLAADKRFTENTNLVMKNNLWYMTQTGGVLWINAVNGVTLINNTFWAEGGMGLIINSDSKKVFARNNICASINFSQYRTSPTSPEYDFDYNLVGQTGQGLPLQAHDIYSANPRFARVPAIRGTAITKVTSADFVLTSSSPAIGKGTVGGLIPTIDFFGQSRTTPNDLGGVEYPHSNVGIQLRNRPSVVKKEMQGPATLIDIKGRSIKNISEQKLVTGHSTITNGRSLAGGIYFIQRKNSGNVIMAEKVVINN